MNESNGRLGWARIDGGQISFVGQGLHAIKPVEFGGEKYRLNFDADWSINPEFGRNLTVEVHDQLGKHHFCDVSVGFSVEEIAILNYAVIGPATKSKTLLHEWIEQNNQAFKKIVLEELAKPFIYKSRLYSSPITEFFGAEGTYHLLSACKIGGFQILLTKPY